MILVRNKSKVKINKTFRGGFKDFLTVPTQAGAAQEKRGWVGLDGTLAKHKFRFVTTHLEAYSADKADSQMKELLKSGGPLGSKKTQSILVGDFNSAPGAQHQRARHQPRRQRVLLGDRQGLPQPRCRSARRAASRRTCTRRPTSSRRGSTTSSCGRRSRCVKSGIVGTKQVGGLYPSDHAGITATLRLK